MFKLRLTEGGIKDDIDALRQIKLEEQGVNDFVSSLVFKYIQAYFGAQDVGEGLEMLSSRLDQGGGGMELFSNPVNESYTLECLGCISQTSAILKEIIFNDCYDHDGVFRSCDVGSGTGILTLGAYISGLRKGLTSGTLHMMDHEKKSLEKSKNVLESIIETTFEVHELLSDITKLEEFKKVGQEKIQFWISETIGMSTPKFGINPENGKIQMKKSDIEGYKLFTRTIDPFPDVIKNISQHSRSLIEDVEGGRVALFPDHINGLYCPDGNDSTLQLRTSSKPDIKNVLGLIGKDFSHLETFDKSRRWTYMSFK